MAHNPPRQWFTDEHMRQVQRDIARQQNRWHSLSDLADKMLVRAKAGRNVVLSPGTAEFMARWIKERERENNL